MLQTSPQSASQFQSMHRGRQTSRFDHGGLGVERERASSLIDLGGRLTFAKVRAITRIATPENEAELLKIAETTPADHIGKALAAWSIRNELSDVVEARQHASRSVRWRNEPDGTITATMRFTPLVAGTIQAAIDTQMMRSRLTKNPDGTWPAVANRRADALGALLADGTSRRPDYEVIVHVRGDGNTLDDGTPIPDGPVARLLPDAFVRLLIHDAARHPVNVSSRQRHTTRHRAQQSPT